MVDSTNVNAFTFYNMENFSKVDGFIYIFHLHFGFSEKLCSFVT